MKTNREVLLIARTYLGQGGAIFRKFCGLGGGQPFCNAYVDYVAHKGGVSSLYWDGKKITYCPTSYAWCKKHLAQVPLYLAMPSDPIYFDWEKNGVPNHIGFVEHVISASTIRTIEGNTSKTNKNGKVIATGVVAEKTRTGEYVLGIFRPHYAPKVLHIGVIAVDGDFGYNSIANLERALGLKPTGVLTKKVVKALQKKAGAKPDGDWGKETSKKVQKMTGAKPDGDFGVQSVKKLQKWINTQNKVVPAPKPAPKPTPKPTPTTYTGKLPDLVQHGRERIVQVALELSYAKGTSRAKYTYGIGKPKEAYKKALKEAYPDRSSWSAQCRAGASCDVGAGTILRCSRVDKGISRALSRQIPHIKRSKIWKKTSLKKTSSMKPGDVGIYTQYSPGGHIWICVGNGKIAEANHTAKYFLHIDTDNYTAGHKKVWGIYRSQKPLALRKGDKTKQVKLLRRYLNFYGDYGLDTDKELFNEAVEKAVKDFQRRNGLPVTGVFGSKELKKAKAVRR